MSKTTKSLHIALPSGIYHVADEVLPGFPHSGMSHLVAVGEDRAWIAAAHTGVTVGGARPTLNGTPCVVYELDANTGDVLHSHLFEGIGATTPGSPWHPIGPDSHNQPQVMLAPDGHVIVVLTGHDSPITVARSVEPGTIAGGFAVRTLDIPTDRPNVGASYTALALVGDVLHVVYRSTAQKYNYDLAHVAVDCMTLENTAPVVIASTDPRIQWESGRKHEWYHDLITVDDMLIVVTCPTSAPAGFGQPNRIQYERQQHISRDGGETWQ